MDIVKKSELGIKAGTVNVALVMYDRRLKKKKSDIHLPKKSIAFFYNFISSKEMTAHTKEKEEKS